MSLMPINHFKERLRTREPQFGIFSGMTDPVAAEITAGAGFDWIMIDCEHVPNDLRTVLTQLQAIAPYDVSTVVRPPDSDEITVRRLLDIGVQSLLVPMVESAEQARNLVSAMRYPPAGVRGVGPSLSRAARWNRVEGYTLAADAQMCLVCQIESVAGLDALEDIAHVDGVDALFVGPSDLGASMGLTGQAGHPDVQAAVTDAIARIVATGTPAGVFASAATAAPWIDAGASFVAVGSDLSLFASATSELARSVRSDG